MADSVLIMDLAKHCYAAFDPPASRAQWPLSAFIPEKYSLKIAGGNVENRHTHAHEEV